MGVGPMGAREFSLTHFRATTWPAELRSARQGNRSSPGRRHPSRTKTTMGVGTTNWRPAEIDPILMSRDDGNVRPQTIRIFPSDTRAQGESDAVNPGREPVA